MVELTIVKIIGAIFIIFGGYLEYKYRFSGFDQNRFDPWTERYRKRYPDFEKDEAEKYYKEHEGAFIGQWGEKEFLKQQMGNVCKGICIKYKATGFKGKHRYENGQKLCPTCSRFLRWEGIRCPCCGCRLRSNPKSGKLRRTLQKQKSMIT